jgi:hypothetical protein
MSERKWAPSINLANPMPPAQPMATPRETTASRGRPRRQMNQKTDIEGNGHMAAGKGRVLSDISLLQRWNVLIFSFELNNLAGAWTPQMILEHRIHQKAWPHQDAGQDEHRINPQPLPARQKKADQQNQKGAALSAFFNLNIAPEQS